MTLTGLYFIRERGEGAFCTGQIVRQVGPEAYLLRFDRIKCAVCGSHDDDDEPPLPLELFTMMDLSDTIDEEDREQAFKFFESAVERHAWINWLNAPAQKEGEVVPIAKGKRH